MVCLPRLGDPLTAIRLPSSALAPTPQRRYSSEVPIYRLILLSTFLLAPLLAEDNLRFGQPACAQPVLDKKIFVVCYDPAHKIPAWVGYVLTKADALNKATDRIGSFRADPALPRGERAENADYEGKGYDKGHMAPANDFTRSLAAMKATFVLTNAVPQKKGVNRGKWGQLEGAVHDHAGAHGTVWVYSGPIFAGTAAPKTIGPHKVAVPSHTYKVILCVHSNGDKEMFGFVLPNIDKPTGTLTDYTFSVNQVEKLTGLNFFDALPVADQNRLERTVRTLPAE
jgi:endonuclease G, mitochondrial